MTSAVNRSFLCLRSPAVQVGWPIICAFLIIGFSSRCLGQTAPDEELPKVLMIADPNDDDGLFTAIRAQLSAAPLILEPVDLDATPAANLSAIPDLRGRVFDLTRQHRAAMVFWIELKETCRMNFYVPDASGGRIFSRAVNVDQDSRASRFDVIAVVASSVIEGILISQSLKNAEPGPSPNPPPIPEKEQEIVKKKRKRFEIFAAYEGALVTADKVSHGIALGLGFLPKERIVVSLSFAQNLKERFENNALRLDVTSRLLDLLFAFRLWTRPVDIRLALSWTVDFRSLSTNTKTEGVSARPDDFIAVHSLVPALFAAWLYRERVGLFGRVGASIALNETVYRIKQEGDYVVAFSPFIVKFLFQFGIIVQI